MADVSSVRLRGMSAINQIILLLLLIYNYYYYMLQTSIRRCRRNALSSPWLTAASLSWKVSRKNPADNLITTPRGYSTCANHVTDVVSVLKFRFHFLFITSRFTDQPILCSS